MQRREFLKLLGLSVLSNLVPDLYAQVIPHFAGRTLILLELKGGNDGLNTLIPYNQELYFDLRGDLALPEKSLLSLNADLALHGSMKPLLKLFEQNQVAIVQGLGYKNPNRSHFRSIDIWEAGTEANEYSDYGWCRQLYQNALWPKLDLDGLILGGLDSGPLQGASNKIFNLNPGFNLPKGRRSSLNFSSPHLSEALQHVLEIEKALDSSRQLILQKVKSRAMMQGEWPKGQLGKSLQAAATVLASGLTPGVIKISQGGYDTHQNQLKRHETLLGELAQGLSAFQGAMQEIGLLDQVCLMTYSEFGRRVKPNGSRGTDHGTANVHFLVSGRIQGGIYGKYPDLASLDEGDLVYTTDYRRLYSSVAVEFFKLPATGEWKGLPLGCFRA